MERVYCDSLCVQVGEEASLTVYRLVYSWLRPMTEDFSRKFSGLWYFYSENLKMPIKKGYLLNTT